MSVRFSLRVYCKYCCPIEEKKASDRMIVEYRKPECFCFDSPVKVHRRRVRIIEAFRCPSRVDREEDGERRDFLSLSLDVCIRVVRDIWPSTRSDILREKGGKKGKEISSTSSLLLFFSRRDPI